jgi:hypothetical protein
VNDNRVNIDVRNLGEYGTEVSRIRIRNQETKEVAWEVVHKDAPQIPGFWMKVGDNPVLPENLEDFGYDVVVPVSKQNIKLAPGIIYEVEVWSKNQRSIARGSFIFSQERR